MSIPKHLQEAADQADDLIKSIATPEDQESEETSQDAPQAKAAPRSETEAVQPDREKYPEGAPVPMDDWKERYARYKYGTDQTISQLRRQVGERDQQVSDLKRQMQTLSQQVEELSKRRPQEDPVSSMKAVLSEEELERFDGDDLRVISKIAAAQAGGQVETLKQKLNAVEQQLARARADTEAKARQQEADAHRQRQTSFVEKLRSKLPEIHEIDADPEFGLWLDEMDPDSGIQRRALATHAMQAQDVRRVLDVYRDWIAEKRPAQHARENRVVPRQTASSTASVASQGDIWTRKKVEDFYTKWRQGRISDEQARVIEKDLFAAQTDGRFR